MASSASTTFCFRHCAADALHARQGAAFRRFLIVTLLRLLPRQEADIGMEKFSNLSLALRAKQARSLRKILGYIHSRNDA
jgi:hypothetical protein